MLCKLTANTKENLGHVCILYEVLSCFQFCEQLTSMKALTYSFDKYGRKITICIVSLLSFAFVDVF
jgi:hypothetical protein